MSRIKEENSLNKTKIFLLEQEIIKKNNSIESQKGKIRSLYDLDNEFVKEIYIIDPSKAVDEINDELLLYKKIHQKLIKGIKKNQLAMKKYDGVIVDLQNENSKLKNKFKMQILASNREKNTNKALISQNNRKGSEASTLKSNMSHNNIKGANSIMISDEYKIKMKLRLGDELNLKIAPTSQINGNEEIEDILKNCGLAVNEFEKMMKNKTYSKLNEVVEMLFKSLLDKTMSIHLLEIEIEDLNMKNFKLNQENMNLNVENNRMKNDLRRNRNDFQDDSYLNNVSDMASDYTAGRNFTQTTISNYHKLLEKQQRELNYEPDMEFSFDKKETTIIQNKDNTNARLNKSGISDSASLDEKGNNNKQILGDMKQSNSALESNTLEEDNSSSGNNNSKSNNNSNSHDENTINILSTNSFKSSGSVSSSEFRKGVDYNKNKNEDVRDSNGMNSMTSSAFEDIQVIKSNNNV